MYFCPLYSGSSGNALFCQYGNTRLLIDAGRTGSCLSAALGRIGVRPETLSGILITHEHTDHIQGAGVMARKYHLPLYATQETWRAMAGKIGKVPGDLIRTVQSGRSFWLGEIGVEAFPIPHDAADPVGYRLWGGRTSVSTATDLGVFTEDVYANIAGSTLILLESNHDPDLLRANPHYNQALKARILGDHGHLRAGAPPADCGRHPPSDPGASERGKQHADAGQAGFGIRHAPGGNPARGRRAAAGGPAG